MTYTIGTLADDVMERLGENPRPLAASETFGGIPSVRQRMESRVAAMLPEAGSSIILEASVHELSGGEKLAVTPTMRKLPCGLYGTWIAIPDDYLRLVSLKMASWERAVSETGVGEMQWSRECGIAGCPSRPQAYLALDAGGLNLLGAGSESSSDKLEYCLIWRVPKADTDGNFRFPAALYPKLADRIASKLK